MARKNPKSPFDAILGQERVCSYLSTAVRDGMVSHAYLFLGKPGSGKMDTAVAFAKTLLCENGGCDACATCVSISRKSHPDVHYLEPKGKEGYLVAQIRELIHDVGLAPVRAQRKVYIFDRADRFNDASANAFLKMLEEPPENVVFILLARSRKSVLPTVLSRCTVLPFRTIPVDEAAAMLMRETGSPIEDCTIAIAASQGSLVRARDYLLTPRRRQMRKQMLEILDRLPDSDDLDVLNDASDLLLAAKGMLGDVRAEQEEQLEESRDWLSRGALKELEQQQKNEISQKELQELRELEALVQSWLRDLLLMLTGQEGLIVNKDDIASLRRISARISPEGVSRAIRTTRETMEPISYNVSPELCIENMLFSIREVLACTKS